MKGHELKEQTLSMFPYFGGKARMAPMICEALDYRYTDTFVEPFGGACRVLLNKPRHRREIYNDSDTANFTFVKLMSRKDTAHKLIESIFKTKYDETEFDEAKDKIKKQNADQGIDERLQLATALYVTKTQSRNAMGTFWAKGKFPSTDEYLRQAGRLFAVGERLEGVEAYNEEIVFGDKRFCINSEEFNSPNVMMYLDPSYIQCRKLLCNPDDDKSVGKFYKKCKSNKGGSYATSFGCPEHQALLECIKNSKCKIMISNYENELYNHFLAYPQWHKYIYETTTNVSNYTDENTRFEVLWYNY